MKLCVECGTPCEGSRCDHHKRKPPPTPSRAERHRPAALDRLSKRLRQSSAFCEQCGSTELLELDHVIPISEAPELATEPLNVRVLCRTHNRMRGNRVTDEERQAVYAAIQARRDRRSRHALTCC